MKNKYRFGAKWRIFQQMHYIKSGGGRQSLNASRAPAACCYLNTFLRGRKKPKPRLSVPEIKTCYFCGQIRVRGARFALCKKQDDDVLFFTALLLHQKGNVVPSVSSATQTCRFLLSSLLLDLINSQAKITNART
jgi:hypothetical protein